MHPSNGRITRQMDEPQLKTTVSSLASIFQGRGDLSSAKSCTSPPPYAPPNERTPRQMDVTLRQMNAQLAQRRCLDVQITSKLAQSVGFRRTLDVLATLNVGKSDVEIWTSNLIPKMTEV